MAASTKLKQIGLIDIGLNLTDSMFRGIYHGTQRHKDDLLDVLQRAFDVGLKKMFITGGNLKDSQKHLSLLRQMMPCTAQWDVIRPGVRNLMKPGGPDEYLSSLLSLTRTNKDKVIAIGECGLDYDRLHFCPKEQQLKYFEKQMELAEETNLPLFLHCRNSHSDFIDILRRNRDRFVGGVVHTFDGTKEEASAFLDMGLHIGINGCSLKTAANIEAMCSVPSDRLLIETDAPWCEIRPSHAGSKHIKTSYPAKKKEKWEEGFCIKSRNEPCHIIQVLEVMAAAREDDVEELAKNMLDNTEKLFFR